MVAHHRKVVSDCACLGSRRGVWDIATPVIAIKPVKRLSAMMKARWAEKKAKKGTAS
jgi:hypothetical protein